MRRRQLFLFALLFAVAALVTTLIETPWNQTRSSAASQSTTSSNDVVTSITQGAGTKFYEPVIDSMTMLPPFISRLASVQYQQDYLTALSNFALATYVGGVEAAQAAAAQAAAQAQAQAAAQAAARAAASRPTYSPPTTQAPRSTVSSSSGYSGGGGNQAIWNCIIQHESGGNPTAVNPSSGAGGLVQFLPSTWIAAGGGQFASRAQYATPAEQMQIAYSLEAQEGWSPWRGDGCTPDG